MQGYIHPRTQAILEDSGLASYGERIIGSGPMKSDYIEALISEDLGGTPLTKSMKKIEFVWTFDAIYFVAINVYLCYRFPWRQVTSLEIVSTSKGLVGLGTLLGGGRPEFVDMILRTSNEVVDLNLGGLGPSGGLAEMDAKDLLRTHKLNGPSQD
tara:strand:- start:334 stop:798 length:465 start_codon:yes stop_codon:yes gene_type:complete